jgi:hypothetical protein
MTPTTTITCANHPDAPVASFCRTCGKPLCTACRRQVAGTVFCEEHAPATAGGSAPPPVSNGPANGMPSGTAPLDPIPGRPSPGYRHSLDDLGYSPYTAPTPPTPKGGKGSPALAFLLGMIPGVGAIYNGQYAKGLVHAVIFGLLITAISSRSLHGFEPLLGILIGVFFFYMAFEAHRTAHKLAAGEPVEEFSSLVGGSDTAFPTGAVVLIGLGFLLLLNTLDLISIEAVVRFWPAGLIAIGVYMLYMRLKGGTR